MQRKAINILRKFLHQFGSIYKIQSKLKRSCGKIGKSGVTNATQVAMYFMPVINCHVK